MPSIVCFNVWLALVWSDLDFMTFVGPFQLNYASQF